MKERSYLTLLLFSLCFCSCKKSHSEASEKTVREVGSEQRSLSSSLEDDEKSVQPTKSNNRPRAATRQTEARIAFEGATKAYTEAKTTMSDSSALRLSPEEVAVGFEESVVELEKFIEEFPDDVDVPLARYRQGVALLMLGDVTTAKEKFGQILEETGSQGPEAGLAAFRLGSLDYNGENFEEASRLFKVSMVEAEKVEVREQATTYYEKTLAKLSGNEG